MNGIFDDYMVENGGFLTTADLAFESAEVIFDNKFAHLEYEYAKLMMEHEENLKLIELKILTENGTLEDYEYLMMTEAEAVQKQSKGIFSGLFEIIGNIFRAIKKFLFGDDFLKDLGDKEVNVKFNADPDKLMKEYDQLEGALKEAALKKNVNPLKVVFGAIGGTVAGYSLYRKVGRPLIKKLGKYVDQKAIDLNSLGKSVDDANFTGEDANIAKKGISALKERASKIAECLKAVPKALRHDEDFEDTVSRAEDREKEEAERPAKEAQEAKDKKAADKESKKEAKKEQKEAKREQKEHDNALKREGINPKASTEVINRLKNDTRTDDEIEREMQDIKATLPVLKKQLKKLNPLIGYSSYTDTRGQRAVDTAKGVIGNAVSKIKAKIPGASVDADKYVKRRMAIVAMRDDRKEAIAKMTEMLKYDKALVRYRHFQQGKIEYREIEDEVNSLRIDFKIADLQDLMNLAKQPMPVAESSLDEDIFYVNNDLTDYFMKEYGYNPLEEDFDAILESAFSLD